MMLPVAPRGALSVATAPIGEPLDIATVKAHCRIESTDDDAKLTHLIKVARQKLDGRDGMLGRALMTQSWALKLDCGFPGQISIPLPPLREITSITYVDPDGVTQTLAAEEYQVVGVGGFGPGAVLPKFGGCWPQTRHQREAVTVTFAAGYGAATDVPAPLIEAMLSMIAHWHLNREAVGGQMYEVPMSARELAGQYCVSFVG